MASKVNVTRSDYSIFYPVTTRWKDNIEVGVRIDRLGNSSVQYGLAIFKDKEPQACAFGHFIHVFVDRVSNKPVTIPDSMRQQMQKITVAVAG